MRLKQKGGNGRKYMEIHEGACMFVYHVVLQQVHCKSSFIVHHEEIQRSLHQCFPTFPCRPRGVTISATNYHSPSSPPPPCMDTTAIAA